MILVTGGSGLVGSHLLFELAKRGKKIKALKRENTNLFWVREIFSFYEPEKSNELFAKVDWVDCSLDDVVGLTRELKGASTVYHCAAMVSFFPKERKKMMEANVDGTATLVNACLASGVRRFCHCSSVAALGLGEEGMLIDENNVWKTSKHNSWYSISKFGAEREVWRGAQEGLDVVIVNPSIIIGPGDPSRSSSKIFETIVRGLKFYTGGVTGFVDVRDVAAAMVKLAESEANGERYILNSQNLSYKEFFETLARHAAVKPPKIKANRLMLALVWRFEKIKSLITGKYPLITKETTLSAQKKTLYSNEKARKILVKNFIAIDEAARNMVNFHGKKKTC